MKQDEFGRSWRTLIGLTEVQHKAATKSFTADRFGFTVSRMHGLICFTETADDLRRTVANDTVLSAD